MALTTYRIDRDDAAGRLFLFHGYGAEQHHLAAYVPLVDPTGRFSAVSVRAPHDLPEGDGATWLIAGDDGADVDLFNAAIAGVDEIIEAECDAAGIGPEQCVVGGFSQGGFLSLALAAREGAPAYAGVWAMCCRLPRLDGLPLDLPAAAGRRTLLQIGADDPIIDPDSSRAAAAALDEAGWDVRAVEYEMGHSQTIEMMLDAREWLGDLDLS